MTRVLSRIGWVWMRLFGSARIDASPRVGQICSSVRSAHQVVRLRVAAVCSNAHTVPIHHDPLSDVLRSVRLRGAVFYYVSYHGEWVAEAPAAREIADAVLLGTEHVLEYHLIAKGNGWAATQGMPPARLSAGDIVMFPRGDAHVMSSAPGLRAPPDHTDWIFTTHHDPSRSRCRTTAACSCPARRCRPTRRAQSSCAASSAAT